LWQISRSKTSEPSQAVSKPFFVNTGLVANWIGNLANHDIRRCLKLTRDIIVSPHIHVDVMLKTLYSKNPMDVDPNNAKLAIVRGKYDIYPSGQHEFVQNMFALTTEFGTSPLLGLRILQLLENTHFQHADGETRFVEINHIVDYFNAMNFEPRTVLGWLHNMLKSGLILSYDPLQEKIADVVRVEISPSGFQHLTWARADWIYLESMLKITPLRDKATYENKIALIKADFPYARRQAIRSFLLYLIEEDTSYCVVPDYPQYADQRKLIARLREQVEQLGKPMRTDKPTRFGRPFGSVISWNTDRGFGFIMPPGGDRTILVHINDAVNATESFPTPGTVLEFDQEEREKGPKALKAEIIHAAPCLSTSWW
jgi:cold shock CspA family protein